MASLQDILDTLPRNGQVYIHQPSTSADQKWHFCQQREKDFWQYELNRPTYLPDPAAHIMPSLINWRIDTSFFKGKTTLELGAGPFGFFPGVVEIDPSHLPEVLVIADPLMDFYQRFKVADLIPSHAVRLNAPGEDLPFPNSLFDIVLTNNTLDHVRDCNVFLQEMKRLVKPDGVILISTHVLADAAGPFRSLIKKVDLNHPHHFILREMEVLFDRNGLNLISRSIVPLHHEEKIPPEKGMFQKLIYFIGFRILKTLYCVASPRR